ncbi:MAG: LysM peptidoglycan-binding domain-containing protein [bacterium]|nr:LysM peptidoglycan-binding domain-containing protein [bacterium]
MRSASRTAVIVAAAMVGFVACVRDTHRSAPPASPQPEHRPDVSAPALPPGERPDVLIVEIEEEQREPGMPAKKAEPEQRDADTDDSLQTPTYRTAATPGRALPEPEAAAPSEPADPEPVTIPPAVPSEDRPRQYTVREGDWLTQISRDQYGSPAHTAAILEANRDQIVDPDRLIPGQILTLP